MKNTMKLLVLALFSILLMGCETCPNMISYADVGIKINPMACATHDKPVKKPDEKPIEEPVKEKA